MKLFKLAPFHSAILLAALYFVGLGILSVILGQDVSWDLRNYHFYNPYMLLTGRFKYDVLPAQIQSFFNPLIDIPFFVAVHYLKLPPVVIGFLMGGFHGLNQWLVHLITYTSLDRVSERYKHILGFGAAITSIFGAAYISELGTSIGDNTTSVFVLAGLLLLIRDLVESRSISLFTVLVTGFLFGFGTGLKLTTALYSIALLAAINFVPNTIGEKVRNLFGLIVSMGIGFFLTMGYWIFLMWTNFANPLFPFFNKIFQSPYIEITHNLSDTRFLPRDIWQALFYPFYFIREQTLVAEVNFKETRFAIAYLLIVILLAFILYQHLSKKIKTYTNDIIYTDVLGLFLPFYVAAYLIWVKAFSIYRYLMVLELITPIMIILIVAYLYPRRKPILIISLATFTIIGLTVKPLDWWRMSWQGTYFGIDTEFLQIYDGAVIVMWGDEATGYLVPHFPPSTRFVRLKGNAGLSEGTKMRENAREIIKNTTQKSLYILKTDFTKKSPDIVSDLAKENLEIDFNNCIDFEAKVEKYSICSLKKR